MPHANRIKQLARRVDDSYQELTPQTWIDEPKEYGTGYWSPNKIGHIPGNLLGHAIRQIEDQIQIEGHYNFFDTLEEVHECEYVDSPTVEEISKVSQFYDIDMVQAADMFTLEHSYLPPRIQKDKIVKMLNMTAETGFVYYE